MKYVWTTRSTSLGVDVQMKPMVELTSARPQSFRWWFDEWLVPLSNLVHIASAVPFRARSVRIWTKKHITRRERSDGFVSLWGSGIDSAEPDRTIKVDPRPLRPVITSDQLRNLDLHLIMRRAKASRAAHEVFYGLLSSAMTATDRPTTHRYLDVVTALEAFHSAGRGRGPLSDSDYTSRLQAALRKIQDPPSRRFLKKWTPSSSSYSLEQRLTHLRRQVGGAWQHDAATMAKLRNAIAHGSAHPDHYVLNECFAQAVDLGRRLALAEMGID